jgi:hypothetical protein
VTGSRAQAETRAARLCTQGRETMPISDSLAHRREVETHRFVFVTSRELRLRVGYCVPGVRETTPEGTRQVDELAR